jgi:hypothetical protein
MLPPPWKPSEPNAFRCIDWIQIQTLGDDCFWSSNNGISLALEVVVCFILKGCTYWMYVRKVLRIHTTTQQTWPPPAGILRRPLECSLRPVAAPDRSACEKVQGKRQPRTLGMTGEMGHEEDVAPSSETWSEPKHPIESVHAMGVHAYSGK